jgi:hypothetical protein
MTALAWGFSSNGQIAVPTPPTDRSFVDVDGGWFHSVGILDDGTAIGWGDNSAGQRDIPALPRDFVTPTLRQATRHTLALRSDGSAGRFRREPLTANATCRRCRRARRTFDSRRASTSSNRFSGSDRRRPSAWGSNGDKANRNVPPCLPAGLTYVEVRAGAQHTLLRLSDGSAVGAGLNADGRTTIPSLPAGIRFAQLAAGGTHSAARLVRLRFDHRVGAARTVLP